MWGRGFEKIGNKSRGIEVVGVQAYSVSSKTLTISI